MEMLSLHKKISLLIIIFSFSIPFSYGAELLSCAPFDSDFTDVTGSYDTTAGGGASIDNVDYKIGSGSWLGDGDNDYINWGNVPLGDDSITINMWLNTDDTDSQIIYARTQTVYAEPFQDIVNSDSNHQVFFGSGPSSQTPYSDNPWLPPVNEWFMYTVVLNPSNDSIQIYINGSLIHSENSATQGTSDNTGVDFLLGARGDSGVGEWDGNQDEVSIYNGSLSASEILLIYNNECTCQEQYLNTCGVATPSIILNHNMENTSNYNETELIITYNATITNSDQEIFECNLFNDSLILLSSDQTNLSNNQIFNISTFELETDYFLSITCSFDDDYNATNFTINRGTYISGNLSSIWSEDGDILKVQEQSGSNASFIKINFTSVSSFDRIHLHYNYSNNPSEQDKYFLKIFNFSSGLYKNLGELPIIESASEHELSIDYDSDFINSGESILVIQHPNNGNTGHIFELDHINLELVNFTDTTDTFEYKIDSILPELSINSPFTNNSQYNTGETVTFSTTVSDTNLLAYNISWYNPSGTLLQNIFANNITSEEATNVSSYSPSITGNFSIVVEAWDSHTSNKLKHKFIDLENGLIYNNVIIEAKNIISFKEKESLDKIEFTIEYENKSQHQEIIIKGSDLLDYLPYSDYSGHFVDLGNDVWIDFESDDIKNLVIKKVSKGIYNVSYDTLSKKVTFNSIGDLNYNTKTYTFEVFNEQTELLRSINLNIITAVNAIEMIPLVLLYGILMTLGWTFLSSRNIYPALFTWAPTLGFDIFFATYFYDLYVSTISGSTWQSMFTFIFGASLMLLIVGKIAMFMTIKAPKPKSIKGLNFF